MVRLTAQFNEIAEKKRATTAAYDRARVAQRESVLALTHAIESGLAVYDAICRTALVVQTLPEPERAPAADQVVADYRWWYDASQNELNLLRAIEREGETVARSDEFKQAVAEARIYGYESDRILQAIRRMEQGEKGIPLAEAMDELRRRAGH
jgi:hypothetical protein